MFEFQETMTAFLQTQQDVMNAFLSAGGKETSFDEPPRPSLEQTAGDFDAGPWAGAVVSMDGVEAVSILSLEVEGDPVAEHHTLGGRRISSVHQEWRGLPVLPFSVMAEILAEAASRLVPGCKVVALEDVLALKWIRYEQEPVALEIRARLEDTGRVRVKIHNRGLVRSLRPIEPAVFEGLVVFTDATPTPPPAAPFSLTDGRPSRFTAQSIYDEQWLFHGPALQAVSRVGAMSPTGVEGSIRVLPLAPLLRLGEDPEKVLTDPIVIDNFTHLLGSWGLDVLADNGDVIFPLKMEELRIFGDRPAVGTDVQCQVAILEQEQHRIRVEANIVRPDGRLWMTIRGWEDWRFHWPGQYRDGFRQPNLTFLGVPIDLPGESHRARAVWLEPPSDMGRPVWRDVLEHVQLGADERAAYLALPGPDSRRTHRLWGRIAAKEAARRLWFDRSQLSTYPADLLIDYDSNGRPILQTRLDAFPYELPLISIAHVDGVAVALACDDLNASVGIDVEPVVERSETFEATAFLAGERELLNNWSGPERWQWVARFWCAREALAKATGLGLVDGPSSVEVIGGDPSGRLLVALRGSLVTARPDLATAPIIVHTTIIHDFAVAWTLGEKDEPR